MFSDTNIALSQSVLLGVILAVFAYLGFRRGVNRELLLTLGIVLGILLSPRMALILTPWVNRFYRLGRFALSGGLFSDNPAAAWQAASGLDDLVESPRDQLILTLVIFSSFVLLFFIIGRKRLPLGKTLILRVLGALAGAVNGFLIAYFLSPHLLNVYETTVILPSQELRTTLTATETIARAVFVFLAVMIAFGLYNARGSRKR